VEYSEWTGNTKLFIGSCAAAQGIVACTLFACSFWFWEQCHDSVPIGTIRTLGCRKPNILYFSCTSSLGANCQSVLSALFQKLLCDCSCSYLLTGSQHMHASPLNVHWLLLVRDFPRSRARNKLVASPHKGRPPPWKNPGARRARLIDYRGSERSLEEAAASQTRGRAKISSRAMSLSFTRAV